MREMFPIRESTIFSISELTARALGLLFLAKYVAAYGLASSGLFRTVLPVIGIACALGTVGVPQAVTRLISASEAQAEQKLFLDHVVTCAIATAISILCTIALLFGIVFICSFGTLVDPEMVPLLLMSIPVLIITCLSGTIKGVLLSLGKNFVSAASQILEALVRVGLVMWAPTALPTALHQSGAEMGIAIITMSELTSLVFLLLICTFLVLARQVPIVTRTISPFRRIKSVLSVFRMSVSPTAQSLLASAGFALELPLAEHYLGLHYGPTIAESLVAEYAAVAIPLLCAPMFLTDGMSTALLPSMTARRAQYGMRALQSSVYHTVRAVTLVSIPSSAALYVLAPILCSWFGAVNADGLLAWLAPLALPLYLQAPLASILQAQGKGSALLYSSLFGDIFRIGSLMLLLGVFHVSVVGLVIGSFVSVMLQTATMTGLTVRNCPIRVPWITLCYSVMCSVVGAAFLIVGLHAPAGYTVQAMPVFWILGYGVVCLFFLIVAGELSPRTLGRLPLLGSPVQKTAQYVVSRTRE